MSGTNMNALVLDPATRIVTLETISLPSPGPFELLVRAEAISLNPIDPLYVQHPLATTKRTIGSDFAGTVVSLGNAVPKSTSISIGDRVSGFLQGACSVNERPGAFSEYLVIPWDLVWKIPESVSIEQAAGVSLVALTAAQSIFYRLGLRTPFEYDEETALAEHPEWANNRKGTHAEPINVFIYGSSTAVGLFAAQMIRVSAKVTGQKFRLFGAASKARWEMLKAEPYGYEHLVDYRDDGWAERVVELTGSERMHYAYDCISEGSSVEKVSSLLAGGGKAAIVRSRAGGAWTAGHLPVEPIYGAVWEGLGEEVEYQGFTIPRSPAARDFAVQFYRWLSSAVGSAIKPVPIRLMPGGLEKVVQDGFHLLGSGKMEDRDVTRAEEWMRPVSAEKLVYKL
ncbi:GroES-like protein [Bimuria novae-zelandiae CBS 107.79]|uniref:GroES-like protein n=1 Tax=Bimuria novae-zelandiae CBS 107.79 TaxID=1447943 RepID=A0A6A5VF46_9PLEO|nr:GroES-like protein [Bimuria novae-zelandiae CBS 107.79]